MTNIEAVNELICMANFLQISPSSNSGRALSKAIDILNIDFDAMFKEIESIKVKNGDGYFYKCGVDDVVEIIKKYIKT